MSEQPNQDPAGTGPRRLLRSRSDRFILGVAGGIAHYFRIDPTLVRVGFVATAFVGGAGIVAYLILALAAPEDDGTGRPAAGQRPPLWLIIAAGVGLLVVLPGPLWGAFDGHGWWWGWGGGWALLLLLAGAWAYVVLRNRDRGAPSGDAGAEVPPDREAMIAGAPESPPAEAAQATTAIVTPGERHGPHPVVRAIAIAVLAAVAICVAAIAAALSAWAVATGNGVIAGGVVVAVGAILIAASFTGSRRAGLLIVPALLVGLPAGAMAASEIRFDADIGEREHSPTSAAAIPPEGYRLGVGQLIVDLQGLPWQRGRTIEVATDLGVGRTVVSVPSEVCVEVDATASAGELHVRGERSAGIDPDLSEIPPDGEAPRLVLDSRVDVGQLTVSQRPVEELIDERGSRHDGNDGDDPQERRDAREACEP